MDGIEELKEENCSSGGTGIHARLKIVSLKDVGSIPTSSTKNIDMKYKPEIKNLPLLFIKKSVKFFILRP